MIRNRTAYFLAMPVLLVLLGYVLWPALQTVRLGLTAEAFRVLFKGWQTPTTEAILRSVGVSVFSVVGAGILGTGLSWLFYRYDFPMRKTLMALATMPLALPPLVGVLSFLYLYGASGILPRFLQSLFGLEKIPFVFEGFWAVWLVHVYTQFVYFYLFTSAAFRRMDGSLLLASADLGAGEWGTFRHVVLPLLRPSMIGAGLLVFMVSMASFTAPLLFDGTGRYLTLQIYQYKTNGERDLAAFISTLLTLIGLVALWFAEQPRFSTSGAASKDVHPALRIKTAGWQRIAAWLLAVLLLAFLVMPVLMIVLLSFAAEGSWTTQVFPASYTLAHYTALLKDPSFAEPIRNSLAMAGVSTAANVVFGVWAAFTMVKTQIRGRWMLRFLTALPFAIPGTVIAFNLLVAFNRPSPFSFGQILIGSWWMLPLAYFIRHIPLVVRAVGAALEQYDDRLTEASADLGASPWITFRRVMLPMLAPAMIAGGLLTFVTALGEFVSSIMLFIIDNRPISVEILAQMRDYNFGGAAAYSVLLMGMIALATVTTRWISREEMVS